MEHKFQVNKQTKSDNWNKQVRDELIKQREE